MGIKALLWILLIVPWATVFFLNKDTVKRYMPVTVFTCLLMTIIFQIAYTFKWWTIYQYIVPWGYVTDVSFVYGVFAVGTLWIFRFTSRKFWIYVVANVIVDAIFAFGVLGVALPALGVGEYDRIQSWQYFFVIFALSFVIYGFHIWQQGIFKVPESRFSRPKYVGETEVRRPMGTRIRTK